MSACNARPPAGHPLHQSGVACHLAGDHLTYDQPHSWDIDAAMAHHEILRRSLDALRKRFPREQIERIDAQLERPIVAYDVDENGERVGQPYRMCDLPAGPWLCVTFEGGQEYAIWKITGRVYRVGAGGAVEEDPIISFDDRKSGRPSATGPLDGLIDTGATVADLRKILAEIPDDAQLRGSVVVWMNDEPVRVIGLAPEYEE